MNFTDQKIIKTVDTWDKLFSSEHFEDVGNLGGIFSFRDAQIKFSIFFPLTKGNIKEELGHDLPITDKIPNVKIFKFKNCHFNYLTYRTDNESLKKLRETQFDSLRIEFINCHFEKLDLFNSDIFSKLKLTRCSFDSTVFQNAMFNDLADFYNCYFNQKVIFHKTDFKGTTVFSASTFKQNVLFTYALIEKLIIFRGTKFDKGLDLSCAILAGEMNPFDIGLGDFGPEIIKEKDEKEFEKRYDDCITKKGLIPIKNQRETYRILKEAFVKREDVASSIKYKVLEKKTLLTELVNDGFWKNFFDIGTLILNWLSNNYGKSYWRAFWFIIIFGGFFFYVSSIFSPMYYFTFNVEWETVKQGLGHFSQFLLPTHGIDYLKVNEADVLGSKFLIFDFVGRLIVGYGIYQFIQAFRKYR